MNNKILREVPEKRERYTKHFQMNEKGMAAAVYSVPIHYEEDGTWKEIDNRLESAVKDGKSVYQNRASQVHVSFAEQAGDEALVSVEKAGRCLSWRLETEPSVSVQAAAQQTDGMGAEVGALKPAGRFRVLTEPEFPKFPEELKKEAKEQPAEVSDGAESGEQIQLHAGTTQEDETQISEMMCVPHLASEGMYEDILPDVDLHYTIEGERIKENIRLKTREAAGLPLKFHFTHAGMVMKKEADGSLALYDTEEAGVRKTDENCEPVYTLAKPYMYDQNGEISQAAEFGLETEGGESCVSMILDAAWLQDEQRAYPVVIDPRTETSKSSANIEDTYIFPGTTNCDDAESAYAFGSFLVGKATGNGNNRALLRFKNLPDIGKGSILYAATMYIWQYEYSSYGVAKIPLMAYEITGNWAEKTARWKNQPPTDGKVLDYKEVSQVKNGSTVTITPVGFDVTRLVRQWYNTGKNYGIMLKGGYENDTNLVNCACARFYSSDYPKLASSQFPSGVFYYRNVDGLETYQSYHEQPAGRAGCGYTNDFNGNLVWIHSDTKTVGGSLQAEVNHVYNSSAASISSRLGYGWTLSCLQKLKATGITDYPYVYTDGDRTKHYFYKDTSDGNKLKDEDGLGLTITDSTGADYDHWKCIETKEHMKYTFGKDGYLRFDEDPDGNLVTYEYEPNSAQNYIPYITDPTGAKIEFVYKNDASLSRITAIKDMAGRSIQYTYDSAGNLESITYPDGEQTHFTYDSGHKLLSVTNPEGYGITYEYTNDFRVPRVSRIVENGIENQPGQEMKISYANGNTTIFEEPGLDGEIEQTGDNQKTIYHFDNMGRPVDVIENDGYANHYDYYTSGMKNHKLGKEGSVQKTVYNLLKNPVFDPNYDLSDWYTRNLSEETKGTITTDAGYIGTKCAKLVKTEPASEELICQDVELPAGTYTLSAYVKTEQLSAGAEVQNAGEESAGTEEKGAALMLLKANGTRILSERVLRAATDPEVDGGWERLTLAFTLTEQEQVTVSAGILGMSGTLSVSGVQLEEGCVANKLNLILNSGFEHLASGVPENWTFSSDVQGSKSASDSEHGSCVAVKGRRDKALNCKQAVHVSGSEGDIYSVSCYVNGCGIPGKKFQLVAEVVYGANDVKKHEFACSPNISGWQFVSGVFSTDDENASTSKTYSAINVYLQYDNQMNQVLIDGMQLVRDDGESYVYDSNGNLISAVSAAEKSHFVFDGKDSLTRMGQIDGTAFDYGYDSKYHLTNASNSEGVRYRFAYDEKGMPSGMTVEGGKHLGVVTPGRIYYIRDQYSGHYMKPAGQADSTAVKLYAFTGAADQKWKAIDCKDGYLSFESLGAPGKVLDLKRNSKDDGAVIQIYSSNQGDSQKWKLRPNQNGSYQICGKGTGDKKGPSNWAKGTVDGQAVLSYTVKEGNTFQNWFFEPADEGHISEVPEDGQVYYIRGRRSGQYIDVQRLGTAAGTRGMQSYYNGGKNQQFRLNKYDEKYFYLEPLHAPGMVLAKSGTNDKGYPRLALEAKSAGKVAQLFWFDETEPGKGTGYAIVCKDGNTALDVMNYSYVSGTDIILTAHTKVQDNKWWILEKCSDRMESSMEYTDDRRQVKSVTDTRDNTTSYTYDAGNRLLDKLTDAKGNATSYTYDADTDKLIKVSRNVSGQEVSVDYAYDKDHLKSITRNGISYEYGYDAYGNQTAVSVGDTVIEKTAYCNKNGLTDSITFATGEVLRDEYDAKEQLTAQYLVKADGTEEKLFANTYDNYGNVVRHEDYRAGRISRYQYDFIGRLLGEDEDNGFRVRTVYDDKNRVKSYLCRVDGKGNKTEFIYGDPTIQQKPGLGYGVKINGAEHLRYIYDELGRITKQTRILSETASADTEYTFVPGREKGLTTSLIESVTEGDKITSDAVGNITEIWDTDKKTGTKERRVRYYYDELDQLIREDNHQQNETIVYTYDAGGNLMTRGVYDYTEEKIPSGPAVTTDTYTYGNDAWKDQLTAYNGQEISYDAMGNSLSYRGKTMEWEQGRRLVKITGPGLSQTNSYDSNGIRTKKVVNGVTTEFYTNGAAILVQKSSDGTRLDFLYDDKGNLFAMDYDGNRYFYQKNIQGDITGLIDVGGEEVVSYTYDTWGRLLDVKDDSSESLAELNPFRYRGYYYDAEAGLYYVSSRYYDPETRRFVNADGYEIVNASPMSLVDKNVYAYCDNNPICRIDKHGDMWQVVFASGGSLSGAWVVGGSNVWNPAGWTILGIVAITTVVYVGYRIYRFAKSQRGTARPELKKQGRENQEKKKQKKNWKKNSGKKSREQPRPHHPSKRGHRKYGK